jgi:hypothetical protein
MRISERTHGGANPPDPTRVQWGAGAETTSDADAETGEAV